MGDPRANKIFFNEVQWSLEDLQNNYTNYEIERRARGVALKAPCGDTIVLNRGKGKRPYYGEVKRRFQSEENRNNWIRALVGSPSK